MDWHFERVFLVRHGETEWNVEGRRQGQLDSPLTLRGQQHAEAIAQLASSWSVDVLLSSPLGRAHRTATVIAEHIGPTVTTCDGLAELHHGSLAGLTNQEIDERFPGLLEHRESDKYNWQFPGGESYREAALRARRVLERVRDAGYVRPMLVTHEMIGRMLLAALVPFDAEQALAHNLPHGSVAEISPNLGSLVWYATDTK